MLLFVTVMLTEYERRFEYDSMGNSLDGVRIATAESPADDVGGVLNPVASMSDEASKCWRRNIPVAGCRWTRNRNC